MAPWKHSLSRFPWWNLKILSVGKAIIDISMVLIDEWHHGKDKYQHFHGDWWRRGRSRMDARPSKGIRSGLYVTTHSYKQQKVLAFRGKAHYNENRTYVRILMTRNA
jgi:hypothetical protein